MSWRIPRCVAALAVATVVACSGSAQDEAGLSPDGPGAGSAAAECVVDQDCSAAGTSCCECPTFAVADSVGWEDSCEDVTCDAPTDCSTEAVCDKAQCVLQCVQVVCNGAVSCENGFARDADGCLSCACAGAPDPGRAQCTIDSQCVRVAADCCGCSRGGADMALPTDEADGFTTGLDCAGDVTCPEINVCDPGAEARCIGGSCQLVGSLEPPQAPDAGTDPESRLCGSSQLPPCPAGESCVLNDPDSRETSSAGLGNCQ